METRRAAFEAFLGEQEKLKAKVAEVEAEIRALAELEQHARVTAANAERDLRHARRRFAKLRERIDTSSRTFLTIQLRTASPQIEELYRWLDHLEERARGSAPKGTAQWVELELRMRKITVLRQQTKRLGALPLTETELAERIQALKADAMKNRV